MMIIAVNFLERGSSVEKLMILSLPLTQVAFTLNKE
jgi:hypothetical protein